MSDRKIRVLLVDDSGMAREMLRDILQRENDIEVVGEAKNGLEAVEKAGSLKPDIITMDLEMPVMNGMEAIAAIMGSKAVPIMVVSGVADAKNGYEATRRGALDVVCKPDYTAASIAEFTAKLKMLAKVPVITHIRPKNPESARPVATASPVIPPVPPLTLPEACSTCSLNSDSGRIFAIASSTGGPQVLSRILPDLPADFSSSLLIAQHISEGFAEGMADWLNGLCKLKVKLARHGEAVEPGVVYISPAEYHCTVNQSRRIQFVDRLENDLYRPSCDKLLSSVADSYKAASVGIILTGMGRDGMLGMTRIKEAGGVTIAQNSETSLIYGMNRCAVEAGVVGRTFADSEIAAEIIRLAAHGCRK